MFYTLGCFHKGLSSTLSYYCYDVAILALKAFAVKLNGIQKQRTWSSQRAIQSEKFIYFFLHGKCTLSHSSHLRNDIKRLLSGGCSPAVSLQWKQARLSEVSAWGAVSMSVRRWRDHKPSPPHAVPFHRLPGLYDNPQPSHTLSRLLQWHSSVASRLWGAEECVLCLAVKMEEQM